VSGENGVAPHPVVVRGRWTRVDGCVGGEDVVLICTPPWALPLLEARDWCSNSRRAVSLSAVLRWWGGEGECGVLR
jgi:hypothetical protein